MGQNPNDPPANKLAMLIAQRQAELSHGNDWADYADEECSAAVNRLATIQDDLLASDFGDHEARMHGLALLLSGSDAPNFADDFKNRLFDILRDAVSVTALEEK